MNRCDTKARRGRPFRRSGLRGLLAVLVLVCCAAPGEPQTTKRGKNEVIVMGMIHDQHRTSSLYGIKQIQDIVRRINPDYILCEIPPDRLEAALSQFRKTGKVTEPRVKRFPEYVDAIFPLTKEIHFQIVPCAAWTKPMADNRREKLERYRTTRKKDYEEMTAAENEAGRQIKSEGMDDDPAKIHTERYDAIVKKALEPYNRLFNKDLGAGGWDNINAAHYALIAKALDGHQYEGKRFLITFGAWHKYWIKEKLRTRNDIVLRPLGDFLHP